jgi:hypothetical protein
MGMQHWIVGLVLATSIAPPSVEAQRVESPPASPRIYVFDSGGHQVVAVKLANRGTIVLGGDLYHYPEERTIEHDTATHAALPKPPSYVD